MAEKTHLNNASSGAPETDARPRRSLVSRRTAIALLAGASAITVGRLAGWDFGAKASLGLAQRFRSIGKSGVPTLKPGENWAGTPASGFATLPADPERTTAKPAMRLLVVPNQTYTGELVVGVIAGANNKGSLRNLGLSHVVFHYEGSRAKAVEPSYYTYADVNGKSHTVLGWWTVLLNDGRQGSAQLYVEAVPADPLMQARVMGPFPFHPAVQQHDRELTVAPSRMTIPGMRYKSVEAALGHLRDVSASNGRITIVENGTYTLSGIGKPYLTAEGWTTIEASVPVTFALEREHKGHFRPMFAGLRLAGSNITIDMRHVAELRPEAKGLPFWFDGVRIVNSGGRDELWDKHARPSSWTSRRKPYFTDCYMEGLANAGTGAALLRCNTLLKGTSDCVTSAECVVGNLTDDWSSETWKRQIPSLDVRYAGGAGDATLQISGGNGKALRTFTAREDGKVVGTFEAQGADAKLPRYHVHEVVDWLNSLAGWQAALLDDSRFACALGPRGVVGTAGGRLAETNVKDKPLTLITLFDFHADWWQKNAGTVPENVIIADNTSLNIAAADLFINLDTARDYLIFNNVFSQNTSYATAKASQFLRPTEHVVLVHNSMPDQAFLFMGQYRPDAYSLVANNVFKDWTVINDAVMRDNHLLDPGRSGAGRGSTAGGTLQTLFPGYARGDMRPSGELQQHMKAPVLEYGREGRFRSQRDVVGAG